MFYVESNPVSVCSFVFVSEFLWWSKCLKPDILITQFYRWFVSNLALSVSVLLCVFWIYCVFSVVFRVPCVFSCLLVVLVFAGLLVFMCCCGWQTHTLTSATGNNFFSAKNCTSPLVVQHQAFTFSWVFSKFLWMIY